MISSPLTHALVEERLDNGLPVVIAPLPHLHTVTVTLTLRGGSRYEAASDHGASHVLEHMIFRGTDLHPEPHALNLAIESIGGAMDASTHVDFVEYQLSLPPESLEEGLEAWSRIFHAPRFEGLEIEKAILREELLSDLDDDGRELSPDDVSRRLLFGEHPLGRSIGGDIACIDRVTEADLRRLLEAHYVAANASLSFAGAVEPDAALALARRLFGSLPRGAAATCEPAPSALPDERLRVVHNSDSQTDLRLSFATIGDEHPDARAMSLLERIFDDGLSSRLHRRICDELGLSYELFAALDAYQDCGVFDLGATVAHEKVPLMVESMLVLLDELAQGGVTEEELERAKRRQRWDLLAALDAAAEVSAYYAHERLYGRSGDFARVLDESSRVTTDDVNRVARAILGRDKVRVACVGEVGEKARRRLRESLGL